MVGRRRVILGVLGAVAIAGGLARVALPGLFRTATAPVRAWLNSLPDSVTLAAVLLVGIVLWIAGVWLALKLAYRGWRLVDDRVKWAVGLVMPESPLVKLASGIMLMIVLVIVVMAALPWIASLGDSESETTTFAEGLASEGLNSDWESIVEGDAVGGNAECDSRGSGMADADGDGLPDAWERAGETPSGADLSDADPGRKDLYVQVNYGDGVDHLSEAERSQLEDAWAEMPVENPDGSTGITLHVVDDGPGGSLGESVDFTDKTTGDYYTEDIMGPRHCVYRSVTYGTMQVDGIAGLGTTPGYATQVHGTNVKGYGGEVSFRVAVTIHELLHTTAGRVGGSAHTSDGWLHGGAEDEYLSDATTSDLNQTGLYGPAS